MATQKFMGKNQLVKRLSSQVGSKGLAVNLLKKRGDMAADGTLTAAGKKRNTMTAEQRAKDRAATAGNTVPGAFTYDPKTNRAKRK